MAKPLRVTEETPSHYKLEGEAGTFRVAKKGLSGATRRMVEQLLAKGGPVRRMAEGGDPGGSLEDLTDLPATPDAQETQALYSAGNNQSDFAAMPPGEARVLAANEPVDPAADLRNQMETAGAPMENAPEAAQLSPEAAAVIGKAHEHLDATERQARQLVADPTQPSHVRQAAAQVVPAVQGAREELSQNTDTLGDAVDEAVQGMRDQAQAQADLGNASAAIQQEANAKKAQAMNWAMGEYRNAAQHGDDLAQWFLTSPDAKVDANRLFADKSTGQQIAASVGLMLSSLGSAGTGQPNLAYNNIQTAIARDIDAQKSNLAVRSKLFDYYAQRGHDAMAAGEFARAAYTDLAAGQLQAAAFRATGPMAQAGVEQAIGKLKVEANQIRQRAALMSANTISTMVNATAGAYRAQMLGAQAAMVARAYGQPGSGQSADPQALAMLGGDKVAWENNRPLFFRSPVEAQNFSDLQARHATITQLLDSYAAGIQRSGYGTRRFGAEHAGLKAQRDSLVREMAAFNKNGMIRGTGVELAAEEVPDLSNPLGTETSSNALIRLRELRQSLDRAYLSSRNSHGRSTPYGLPGLPGSGGAQAAGGDGGEGGEE